MISVLVWIAGGLAICYYVLPSIIIWLKVAFEEPWKKKMPGPYPTSLPIGTFGQLATDRHPGAPFRAFDHLIEKYGNIVLLRGGFLTPNFVLVADPKYVTEALANDYKGPAYDVVRIINDNDLFLSDGAYWHRQRKLMNPMFSVTAIKGMYHLMVDELKELKKYLHEQDLSKSININDTFQKVALDVLTSAAFGVNYGALHGANVEAIEAMSHLLQEVEQRSINPIGHMLNPLAHLRLAKLRKQVRLLARKCLEDRKKDADALANRNDLLNMMLKAQDPETGAKMSEEEIISENVIFLVAGHETTAHSMTWFLHHTSLYPEWQKKVQDEIDVILKNKEFPDYDDLSQMTMLDIVIKESMRMTTVTPSGSVRMLTKDVQIGEYFIPKDTALWVALHSLNHNQHNWPDHEKFDPTRFANNQSHYPKFIPFSSGPRNCIGQTFAKVEMRAVLSTMAKYFEWRLDETKPVIPVYAVTQKPKSGLYVYLKPRN